MVTSGTSIDGLNIPGRPSTSMPNGVGTTNTSATRNLFWGELSQKSHDTMTSQGIYPSKPDALCDMAADNGLCCVVI